MAVAVRGSRPMPLRNVTTTHAHARKQTRRPADRQTRTPAHTHTYTHTHTHNMRHLALERVDHRGELAEGRGGEADEWRPPERTELCRRVELLLLGGELLIALTQLAQLRVQRLQSNA